MADKNHFAVEVAAGSRRAAQRGQGPDRADRGHTHIFDMAMQHNGFRASDDGDRRGSGERSTSCCAARNSSGRTLKHELREPFWCGKHRAL